jgi:DNA-binding MurR/RpiR family transcriptional regulator
MQNALKQDDLNDLKKRIKNKIPHLSDSQKMIANYIVENPQKFAISSIRELEEELNTSKSTIVRLAQTLGYNGFHQMKSTILMSIRHNLEPLHRYKTYLAQKVKNENYLSVIANETKDNIDSTLRMIEDRQFNKAVKIIEAADHVYTTGMGISTYLAEIAAYLFNRVSKKSNYLGYSGLNLVEQIINLSKDDIILAFSFPPYSEEIIEAASYAKEKNIKVISITDKATSRIIQFSDVYLLVAAESETISNSIMSALFLLYSFTKQIGHDLKFKTLETIKSIEHVREKHSGKQK